MSAPAQVSIERLHRARSGSAVGDAGLSWRWAGFHSASFTSSDFWSYNGGVSTVCVLTLGPLHGLAMLVSLGIHRIPLTLVSCLLCCSKSPADLQAKLICVAIVFSDCAS
ncbi:hypothetical protein ABBQ38_008141 [Trebouxia sp. C0009 RCD-2024]